MSLEKKDWVLGYLDKLDRTIQNFYYYFCFFLQFVSLLFILEEGWAVTEYSIPLFSPKRLNQIQTNSLAIPKVWMVMFCKVWNFTKAISLPSEHRESDKYSKSVKKSSFLKEFPQQQVEMWKCKCQFQFFCPGSISNTWRIDESLKHWCIDQNSG